MLLAEAFWSLAVARGALWLFPFQRVAARLGTPMLESPQTYVEAHRVTLAQIDWAIQAISRRVPGTSQCLVQALAAMSMLKCRNLSGTLYFGVAKDETGHVIAHAWVRCGTQVLTGAHGRRHFTVVGTFAQMT